MTKKKGNNIIEEPTTEEVVETPVEEVKVEPPHPEEPPRHAGPDPLVPEEPVTEPVTEPLPEVLNESQKAALEPVVEKPKKKVNPIALAILVLVLLAIACLAIWYGVTHKNKESKTTENTAEKEIKRDDKSIDPPEGVDIVDINTLNNGHGGQLALHCTFRDTLNYVEDRTTKPGDEIQCSYGIEVVNGLKVDAVFLQLDYGKGLSLTSTSNIKSGETIIEGNKLRSNIKEPSSILEEVFTYYFEVKEEATTDNLSIDVTNIVVRTVDNKYYKLPDVNKKFTRNSSKYYVYKGKDEDGETYINVLDKEDNHTKDILYGIYECQTDICDYINDASGNYVLFEDGGYKAYNFEKNKVEDLSQFNKYYDLDLVATDKLIGLILYEGEDGEKSGYYSIEKNKLIVPIKKDVYFFVEDTYIYYFGEGISSTQVIDFQGNKYKPTKKDLERYGKTDFYLFYLERFFEASAYVYDKDGNPKLGGEEFLFGLNSPFEESSNHNLLMVEDGRFVEIDINEKEIYRSAKYKDIVLNTGYIGVVDKRDVLIIMDERENVLTEFEDFPYDYVIHEPLSWVSTDDEEYGVHITVETETVNDDEMMEYLKKEYPKSEGYTEEDWKDYLEGPKGYTYYYNPKTGEKSKTPMVILGYD
ncbi:MAG: hypothetical protein II625_03580 [Bacilli bacterium]|nr:hypothetical protein [Bacilli bacterium]